MTATDPITIRSDCSRCAHNPGGARWPNSWTRSIRRAPSTAGLTAPTTQALAGYSISRAGSKWTRPRSPNPSNSPPTQTDTKTTNPSPAPSSTHSPSAEETGEGSRETPRFRKRLGWCSHYPPAAICRPQRLVRGSTRSPALPVIDASMKRAMAAPPVWAAQLSGRP